MDEALGNLTVSRETGLMPIPMITGDELRLAGQEGLFLTVTAGPNTNDPETDIISMLFLGLDNIMVKKLVLPMVQLLMKAL